MICIPIKGLEDKIRVTSDSRQIRIEQAVKQKEEIVWVAKGFFNDIQGVIKGLRRRTVFSDSMTKKIISTLEDFGAVEEMNYDRVENLVAEMDVQFKRDVLALEREISDLREENDSLKKKVEYHKNKA